MAQIMLRSVSAEGSGYVRTCEHVFHMLSDKIKLGAATSTALVDDTRLRLSLPALGLTVGRKVVAYAKVWGMRDPAQTSDSARSADMNANAGR